MLTIFLSCFVVNSQIANYITNGGFEDHYTCTGLNHISKAKGWRTIDSIDGGIAYASTCYSNVPYNGFSFQYPKNGNAYGGAGFIYCPTSTCNNLSNSRGYFRNRLKSNLIAGKTYCIKLYVNISNQSTYGISNVGFFFVDNSIDTITQYTKPLTYITPQFENSTSNIITDTLGWTLITGTFVANGTEKNCVIGNFKSDSSTTKTMVNPTNLPIIGCDIWIDDVSCIPTDLPAFAGADVWGIPNTTVYIGRPRDVGIDEACTWYNMSNTLTPIATAAGLTVTVALNTQTYMVKQDICGIIKYDTVIVHASALGNTELQYFKDQIHVYPQPANKVVNVELSSHAIANAYTALIIYNTLGQAIRHEEVTFTKSLIKQIDVADLPHGYYTIQLHTTKGYVITKAMVISH